MKHSSASTTESTFNDNTKIPTSRWKRVALFITIFCVFAVPIYVSIARIFGPKETTPQSPTVVATQVELPSVHIPPAQIPVSDFGSFVEPYSFIIGLTLGVTLSTLVWLFIAQSIRDSAEQKYHDAKFELKQLQLAYKERMVNLQSRYDITEAIARRAKF